MNEKAVFFFSSDEKKNTASRSIEWMACELLQEKKKHKKNTQKFGKKKTHPTFKKNKEKPTTSWMNASWTFSGKKKIHPCIFFFRFAGKKKTQFYDLNEWMAHELFR